jgi:hypothetical protein
VHIQAHWPFQLFGSLTAWHDVCIIVATAEWTNGVNVATVVHSCSPLQENKGGMDMSGDLTKRLNLMRFWLFGTFVIVFAAITIYIGMFVNRNWLLALRSGLPIWGIVGVLCVIWYYGYKYWISRKISTGGEEPPAPYL